MKQHIRNSVIGVLAVGALALTGCSASTGAEAEEGAGNGNETVKLVVFGGIGAQGTVAGTASTSIAAAEAGIAKVNAEGGILGKQVELEVIDDRADATLAVTKLRELLAEGDAPLAIMNSGPSPIAEATIPLMSQSKIISFNIGPTPTSADPAQSPYNFDLAPSVLDHIGGFVPAMEKEGYEKVGVFHSGSAYGEQYGSQAGAAFEEAGFDVVKTQGFDVASLDMLPELSALQAADPDVIVLEAYGAPLGYILEGLEKLGWDVPVMGTTSVSATALISTEPPSGVLGTSQTDNLSIQMFTSTRFSEDATVVNEAVESIADKGEIGSSLTTASNYDAVLLLKAAAEAAGSLETEAIVAEMTNPKTQKAAGTVILNQYRFTDKSHAPNIAPEEFVFVSPGPMINGQFHPFKK